MKRLRKPSMCPYHHCHVPGGSTIQNLHLQTSWTGQLTRSNRYNFWPSVFFCSLRGHYSYFPLWACQGSQSERKGREKAAKRSQKGRKKAEKSLCEYRQYIFRQEGLHLERSILFTCITCELNMYFQWFAWLCRQCLYRYVHNLLEVFYQGTRWQRQNQWFV